VAPGSRLLPGAVSHSELVGIPLGKPGALSIESGSSLGFLMLVGHGRELIREKGVGIDSWTLFSQPHPLIRFLPDGLVCRLERLM